MRLEQTLNLINEQIEVNNNYRFETLVIFIEELTTTEAYECYEMTIDKLIEKINNGYASRILRSIIISRYSLKEVAQKYNKIEEDLKRELINLLKEIQVYSKWKEAK